MFLFLPYMVFFVLFCYVLFFLVTWKTPDKIVRELRDPKATGCAVNRENRIKAFSSVISFYTMTSPNTSQRTVAMTNHILDGVFCTKIRSPARGFNLKFYCVSLDVISFFLIFTWHVKSTISHFFELFWDKNLSFCFLKTNNQKC